MEQITAKEQAIINKWAYHMRESAISEEDAIKEAFLELRSVSETKEPDGYVVLGKFMDKHEASQYHDDLLTPVYFSPVPVSEVGQMEEKQIKNLWDKYKKSEIDTDLFVMHYSDFYKALTSLPVPNTKTVEGEDFGDFLLKKHGLKYENDVVVIHDLRKDFVEYYSSLRSNTEEKEFSPMAFALRSNEPEREGYEGTVDLFAYFNSKGIYSNGTGTVLTTINGDNIVDKMKEIFSEMLTKLPSPPLKALSEEEICEEHNAFPSDQEVNDVIKDIKEKDNG